jgi:UDP-N-acetylglucosamine 2-epimerase (non-hydrolysing)
MKAAIVVGVRPEVIKIEPVVRALKKEGHTLFIITTDQHYSHNLFGSIYTQLELPLPKYTLKNDATSPAHQVAVVMTGVFNVLNSEFPDILLSYGDSNSSLGGALGAVEAGIPVGHIEAGLRSYDRQMPEEINRVLIDHTSDLLFAPTKTSKENLKLEGIRENVAITGNTVVDVLKRNLSRSERRVRAFGLEPNGYVLLTTHRQENVDNLTKLKGIITGVNQVAERLNKKILFPVHPRTKKTLDLLRLALNKRWIVVEPIDYLSFLSIERNAALVLTDSGGVQEEACILRVPCVTLRTNTERPETLTVKANILAGTEPSVISAAATTVLKVPRIWENPFGDGTAGKKITTILVKKYG